MATIKTIDAKEYLELVKNEPKLVTLDCTWYPTGEDGYAEYLREHIKGARYYPFYDVVSDSKYPMMLPTDYEEFITALSSLGVKRDDYLVIYDQQSVFPSPRASYVLATFDHPNVVLLDSYKEYKKLGGPLSSGPSPQYRPGPYTSGNKYTIHKWYKFEEIVDLIESGSIKDFNLIDTRLPNLYEGGHIKGATNIPFKQFLSEEGKYKSKEEILNILKKNNVDMGKPFILYCNTGTTACIEKAGIDKVAKTTVFLYDGSYSEWKDRAPDSLIVK